MLPRSLLASVAPVLFAVPPLVHPIELPKRPIHPNATVDARGSCAVVNAEQLGFIALTTDDGASFRYLPSHPELHYPSRFTCWAKRFFAISESANLLRLTESRWERVWQNAPFESSFRGFVTVGSKLYVGTGSQVVVSSDAGSTFSRTLSGVSALASAETRVIAAKGNELYTVDENEALTLLSKLPKPVHALGFAANRWFASVKDGPLFGSDDQGKTWKREPGSPSGVQSITSQGSTLIANLERSAWFREPGGTWRQVPDAQRVVPAASGYWVEKGGGPLKRVGLLADKGSPFMLPTNPTPSVRLLVGHGTSIVVALNYAPELLVSNDAGRTWRVECENTEFETAALDGDRLQLSTGDVFRLKDCRIPGFKTRAVPKLPDETCNGALCVRFGPNMLLRSKDRGKAWQDLTANVGRGEPIVAAAVAGPEILIARGLESPRYLYGVRSYARVLRSVDDGKTFRPFSLPESTITAFASSERGWLVGTTLHGLALVPFASAAPTH